MSKDIAKLLADAKLMAGVAARLGRLPNQGVLAAIERLETKSLSAAERVKAVTGLTAAVNQLARAISPNTLVDLGSDWRPNPKSGYNPIVRTVIVAASVVLIGVLGYFSILYTQARITAGELAALQAQDVAAKSEHLYDHWQTIRDKIPPKSLEQHDDANSYYHEIDALKALQDHLIQYTGDVDDLRQRSNPSTAIVYFTRVISPKDIEVRPASASSQPPSPKGSTTVQPTAAAPLAVDLSQPSSEISAVNDPRSDYNELPSAASNDPTTQLISAQVAAADPTIQYYKDIVQFLETVGITDILQDGKSSVEIKISNGIRICNDLISTLGFWILPPLYGLFGAMVFQLRSMMNPLVSTPGLFLVRCTLATMAGVVVSWLFSALGPGGANVHPGGVTVFGLAFVFGYSLDVFFAALDRAVASVSKWAPMGS